MIINNVQVQSYINLAVIYLIDLPQCLMGSYRYWYDSVVDWLVGCGEDWSELWPGSESTNQNYWQSHVWME